MAETQDETTAEQPAQWLVAWGFICMVASIFFWPIALVGAILGIQARAAGNPNGRWVVLGCVCVAAVMLLLPKILGYLLGGS